MIEHNDSSQTKVEGSTINDNEGEVDNVNEVNKLWDDGEFALSEKDYISAVRLMSDAYRLDSNKDNKKELYVEALIEEGKNNYVNGFLKTAYLSYQEAFKIDPQNTEVIRMKKKIINKVKSKDKRLEKEKMKPRIEELRKWKVVGEFVEMKNFQKPDGSLAFNNNEEFTLLFPFNNGYAFGYRKKNGKAVKCTINPDLTIIDSKDYMDSNFKTEVEGEDFETKPEGQYNFEKYENIQLLEQWAGLTDKEQDTIAGVSQNLLQHIHGFYADKTRLHTVPGMQGVNPHHYAVIKNDASITNRLEFRNDLVDKIGSENSGLISTIGSPIFNLAEILPHPNDEMQNVLYIILSPEFGSSLANTEGRPSTNEFTLTLDSNSDVLDLLRTGNSAHLLPHVLREVAMKLNRDGNKFFDVKFNARELDVFDFENEELVVNGFSNGSYKAIKYQYINSAVRAQILGGRKLRGGNIEPKMIYHPASDDGGIINTTEIPVNECLKKAGINTGEVTAGGTTARILELWNNAKEELQNNNFHQAIEKLNKALELNPKNIEVKLILEDAYVKNGFKNIREKKIHLGVDNFQKAYNLYKTDKIIEHYLLTALEIEVKYYFDLKKYSQALESYEKIISISPNNTNAKNRLAEILNKLKESGTL